ncbi:hypothetical protein OSB04_009739 [Centaurea solstitialis]|uniref:Phytocyanin domain-containing protein n=1 Tax=Centaurea solstitialis TaxID=347529 RepID=A0AA38WJZ3_9ASTR|nr:hypothetical protein OSB04_009739 [Centaurea solstitialis]
MATFSHIVVVFAIAVVLLPATTMATDYVVGDESGWTTNYDYQAWAKGKTFCVGDNLVFKYAQGSHNVFKVDGAGFANCTIPLAGGLTSGNDVVTLSTPGKKWYICGIATHCADKNQKLVINVDGMAPAPAPSSATKYGSKSFMAVVVLAIFIMF